MKHIVSSLSCSFVLTLSLATACGTPVDELSDNLIEEPEVNPNVRGWPEKEAVDGKDGAEIPPGAILPETAAQRILTPSGLAFVVLQPGRGGAHPTTHDAVRMDYVGWGPDGEVLADTVSRGRPATFPVRKLIPGVVEAVTQMSVGEKRRIWVPPELGFEGGRGAPEGSLVYEIELHEILEPPAAPTHLVEPDAGARWTRTGLAWLQLEAGRGKRQPSAKDTVRVHYTAWTEDGELVDSSVLRGHPDTLSVDRTAPGVAEGLQQMVEGERRRFWVPEHLGYEGMPGAPMGQLIFEVQLIEIVEQPDSPPSVEVPQNASLTATGLASLVLQAGAGVRHPQADSLVTIHYTGWDEHGEVFDSSLERGQPSTFTLSDVIAGWSEGIQLMVEGERRRLWVPEALGPVGHPDRTAGVLVYDIELMAISN